jgi:multisubunit Na+/H+ antiporter MnhB subunit
MIQLHDSVIVQAISRMLIPLVQLFAVYIVFFGQYSPGGG